MLSRNNLDLLEQSLRTPKFYLCLLLIVLATITSAYLSLDAVPYQRIFEQYSSSSWMALPSELKSVEAFFLLLAKLYSGWPSILWFVTIAVLSVTLKLLLIEKASRHFYWSIAVYLSCFFVLFDGTVIRASLAIIIAYWGAWFFSQGRHLLAIFLIILAATCFHYSLAFFLVVFLFASKRVSFFLIVVYPILIGLWFLGYDFFRVFLAMTDGLDLSLIGFSKLRIYLQRIDSDGVPYTLHFLSLYVGTVLVFWRFRNDASRFETICFNCIFMCLVVVALFVGSTTIQSRVSDIFRFGLIFVMPFYIKYAGELLNNDFLVKSMVLLILSLYFYKYMILPGLLVWPF